MYNSGRIDNLHIYTPTHVLNTDGSTSLTVKVQKRGCQIVSFAYTHPPPWTPSYTYTLPLMFWKPHEYDTPRQDPRGEEFQRQVVFRYFWYKKLSQFDEYGVTSL